MRYLILKYRRILFQNRSILEPFEQLKIFPDVKHYLADFDRTVDPHSKKISRYF